MASQVPFLGQLPVEVLYLPGWGNEPTMMQEVEESEGLPWWEVKRSSRGHLASWMSLVSGLENSLSRPDRRMEGPGEKGAAANQSTHLRCSP